MRVLLVKPKARLRTILGLEAFTRLDAGAVDEMKLRHRPEAHASPELVSQMACGLMQPPPHLCGIGSKHGEIDLGMAQVAGHPDFLDGDHAGRRITHVADQGRQLALHRGPHTVRPAEFGAHIDALALACGYSCLATSVRSKTSI